MEFNQCAIAMTVLSFIFCITDFITISSVKLSIADVASSKMKDKTVIAIAHRLNSIAGFDRIILFREGKIVGQGTFEELLHTDSYFKELYNASVKNMSTKAIQISTKAKTIRLK